MVYPGLLLWKAMWTESNFSGRIHFPIFILGLLGNQVFIHQLQISIRNIVAGLGTCKSSCGDGHCMPGTHQDWICKTLRGKCHAGFSWFLLINLSGKTFWKTKSHKYHANKIQTVYSGETGQWNLFFEGPTLNLGFMLGKYFIMQLSSHPLPATCWPIYKVTLTHCSGISA